MGKGKKGCNEITFFVPEWLRGAFKQACDKDEITLTNSIVEFMSNLDGFGISPEGNQKWNGEYVRLRINVPKRLHAEFREKCRKNHRNMTVEVRCHMERVVDAAEMEPPLA